MIKKLICDEYGFSSETMKTLVVKYPAVLSKTKDEMTHFFTVLEKYKIGKEDAMSYLLDYPKIISVDIEKVLKEIVFLFELYH